MANEWWRGLFLHRGDVVEVGKGRVEWMDGCDQAVRVGGGLGDKDSEN